MLNPSHPGHWGQHRNCQCRNEWRLWCPPPNDYQVAFLLLWSIGFTTYRGLCIYRYTDIQPYAGYARCYSRKSAGKASPPVFEPGQELAQISKPAAAQNRLAAEYLGENSINFSSKSRESTSLWRCCSSQQKLLEARCHLTSLWDVEQARTSYLHQLKVCRFIFPAFRYFLENFEFFLQDLALAHKIIRSTALLKKMLSFAEIFNKFAQNSVWNTMDTYYL